MNKNVEDAVPADAGTSTMTVLTPGAATAEPDREALAIMNQSSGAMTRHGTSEATLAIPPSYMKIAQPVGGLADAGFPRGAVVLDKEAQIAAIKEPIVMVVLSGSDRVYWKQWAYTEGLLPQSYGSIQEAAAAGETIAWPPRGVAGPGPTVAEAMDLTILVRKPDGCEDERFILKLDGQYYAPVYFTADKSLYKDMATTLARARMMDANERSVPATEGRTDGFFMQMNTYIVPSKTTQGRSNVRINLGYLIAGTGETDPVTKKERQAKVAVTDKFRNDFTALGLKIAGAMNGDTDDDTSDLGEAGEI